jgi:hypothetical protein
MTAMEWDSRIVSGTASDVLADAIARALGVHLLQRFMTAGSLGDLS